MTMCKWDNHAHTAPEAPDLAGKCVAMKKRPPLYNEPRTCEGLTVSVATHPESTILTPAQQKLIKGRAHDTKTWLDEADLDRRRRISDEIRLTIQNSKILDGDTLDRKTLCRLVSLQWQIQNLNPMQMPRLLGTYHYKVHFRDFSGTREDVLAQVEAETGETAMYEGADLAEVSKALRLISSQSADDHYRGAGAMLEIPGAGLAIVSGFLHLCHPDSYSFINSASTAPFQNDGWLNVTKDQRRLALAHARKRFASVADESDRVISEVFRWQVFLDEVRTICGFADFHMLDQFIYILEGGDRKDPEELLKPVISQLPAETEDTRIRAEAEAKARKLVEANLGSLSATQFSELFELINTCVGKNGVVYNRFSSAFIGNNANKLIEQASELNVWIQKLWTADETALSTLLDQFWEQKIAGSGRALPTAILYLRDKERFAVWTTNLERALYTVVNGLPAKITTGFSYLQYCDRLRRLRKLTGFPPELHDWVLFKVFTAEATADEETDGVLSGSFAGFTADTFQFMGELVANNNQTWFDVNRQRFREQVDRPLRALVKDLGNEVITSLDPTLETTSKANKCISRIRKNVYGKQEENVFHGVYWAAFYRKGRTKQTDCQFFISIRETSLAYGIYFGEQADDVRAKLTEAMETHRSLAEKVFAQIKPKGFLYIPGEGTEHEQPVDLENFDQFAELAKNQHFNVLMELAPDDAVSAGADLKKRIGEVFRTLYPLFKLAVSDDPVKDIPPYLNDGDEEVEPRITIADIAAETFMEEEFFAKLDQYLKDKQQLIFFGPPGTGKTFVALKYGEYLTQDKSKLRTVQFHPSYGYEDFMEGLRPVTRDGQLLYDVEDGIFKKLCDDARADLKGTYVLLIDEINRGNLPRILGELLFLLERREETAQLPYSKKPFSIPRNVIILGTMNSSDRSIALMDLALRRRFHFVTMEPRREILRAWLKANKKPLWIEDVFRRLNDALRSEHIDNDRLVGHAHFMSNNLNEEYLELIWEGTIEPMLREYFFTEPERLAKFHLENFKISAVVTVEDVNFVADDSEEEHEFEPPNPTAGQEL